MCMSGPDGQDERRGCGKLPVQAKVTRHEAVPALVLYASLSQPTVCGEERES
jgi:hypothetical protein